MLNILSTPNHSLRARNQIHFYSKFIFIFLFVLTSFASATEGSSPEEIIRAKDLGHLIISQSSLSKTEFLLRSSFLPQRFAPTGHGLSSRIVSFVKHGNEVFLVESSKGHVVTHDLPSMIILAKFPIIAQSDKAVTIDFNIGMKKLFLQSNWYASDYAGKRYSSIAPDVASEVAISLVPEVKNNFDGNPNSVFLKQVVQLDLQMMFPAYEIRYYLTPYQPNPNFTPKETSTFDKVGFFETNPVVEPASGRSTVYVTKWDISKPVTYYVSANTPKEYQAAMKEGILYWNKAFGREVLRAEIAPEGVTAPDPRYNIIQWVPWDNAGMAYADALNDPRTGEILNAQVFMTSVFAFGTKARARRFLRALRDGLLVKDSKPKPKEHTHADGKSCSECHHLCSMDMSAQIAHAIEGMLAQDPDEADLLRVSQDVIRTVIAHEVGHTLGLRHNFAGKLAANISLAERDKVFNEYLLNRKAPPKEVRVTSSQMDYLLTQDDGIVGSQMLSMEKALPYDELAIQWAYTDMDEFDIDRKAAPVFCTDSNVEAYQDCTRFYSGAKPIAFNVWEMVNEIQGLPSTIVEYYIAAKAPKDARDRIPLEEVGLGPSEYARYIVLSVKEALNWLSKDNRSAFVHNRKPFVSSLNELEVAQEQQQWVKSQITELGGIERVFFSLTNLPMIDWSKVPVSQGVETIPAAWVQKTKEALVEYLAKQKGKPFVGLDGQMHTFTEDELQVIQENGSKFIDELERYLTEELLDAYLDAKLNLETHARIHLNKESITRAMETRLVDFAGYIVLAQKENAKMVSDLPISDVQKPKVLLPVFKFPLALRLKAMKLIKQDFGPNVDWAYTERRAVAEALKSMLQNILGATFHQVDTREYDVGLRNWYMEQMALIAEFRGQPGCDKLLEVKQPPQKTAKKKPDDEE